MNIIELAKQAHGPITSRWWDMDVAALERFAALVRAQALEEAAGVCDELRHPWGYSAETSDWVHGTEHCAACTLRTRCCKKPFAVSSALTGWTIKRGTQTLKRSGCTNWRYRNDHTTPLSRTD